ncbi:hypothetical protein NIES2119_29995 [[Phormidium ambiguum] IAM M-71]|uniref:Uncharacterized protein n=1 Tax=[Phormidium ambiguum] IAM M-71 TaxID=454136 RepID=A0A1U7I433_9CYAN|nr:hypothetical protein [Phormidium ambiguum]OKH30907.1 hypothetical protein NIES2119_29995 [Phormidium ambiguum IAM M-71]
MSSTDNETKLRRATEKLIRSIRLAIQQATPSEALAIWKLMKSLEIRRNTPNLTDAQVEALLTMLAKESGADIIEATLNSNSSIALTSTPNQLEEPALATSNNRKGNNR